MTTRTYYLLLDQPQAAGDVEMMDGVAIAVPDCEGKPALAVFTSEADVYRYTARWNRHEANTCVIAATWGQVVSWCGSVFAACCVDPVDGPYITIPLFSQGAP